MDRSISSVSNCGSPFFVLASGNTGIQFDKFCFTEMPESVMSVSKAMLTLLMENTHATDGKAHATGGKMLMLLMGKLTLLAENAHTL